MKNSYDDAINALGRIEIFIKSENHYFMSSNNPYNDIDTIRATFTRMIETPAPQGWKLVPEIPTDEIIEAMYSIVNKKTLVQPININELYQSVYKVMLSAAPTPTPTEKAINWEGLDKIRKSATGKTLHQLEEWSYANDTRKAGDNPPTEKVDVESLKAKALNDDGSMHTRIYISGYNDAIDYLVNTGRLR